MPFALESTSPPSGLWSASYWEMSANGQTLPFHGLTFTTQPKSCAGAAERGALVGVCPPPIRPVTRLPFDDDVDGPSASSPVPCVANDGRPETTRFCTPLCTTVNAPLRPKHTGGASGSSGLATHGPAPPLPDSAIQRSPFLAMSMPRGLSSPLATTFQRAVALVAWRLGTATSAAITASASSFHLACSLLRRGGWRRPHFTGVVDHALRSRTADHPQTPHRGVTEAARTTAGAARARPRPRPRA